VFRRKPAANITPARGAPTSARSKEAEWGAARPDDGGRQSSSLAAISPYRLRSRLS
jgi:hypothetical protein